MGAYHVPSDPILVPEQMENLIAEFAGNKKLHPIERAALFHLKFESIHPFVDGNGRTGRYANASRLYANQREVFG